MKEIEKLAKIIKDKKLRKKVLFILKNPGKLTNKEFKCRGSKFEEAPASLNWHHIQEGGLLEHTKAVTRMCLAVAENLEKTYKIELDKDTLIAGALLHDIGKLFEMKKVKGNWTATGISLDHTMLGTSELYARGFPEKVLHMVASHFGENGPTPPAFPEAVILHTIDNMDATLGAQKETEILKMLGLG